jgi:hypothetical protein
MAEKEVRFVLTVINHGAFADANAFWFVPRFENIVATQTPKPSNMPTNTPTPTATLFPSPTPSTTPTALSFPPFYDHPIILKAIETFALDMGTSQDQVRLIMVKLMEWPDTCLDLPADGEICAQQITPEFFLLVEHEHKFYRIHTNDVGTNIRWELFEIL